MYTPKAHYVLFRRRKIENVLKAPFWFPTAQKKRVPESKVSNPQTTAVTAGLLKISF